MRRFFFLFVIFACAFLLCSKQPIMAQTPKATPRPTPPIEATASATPEATTSARVATPSAQVLETIKERRTSDITEPSSVAKSKLSKYLEDTPTQPLGPTNFVQHAIRTAVAKGVPANVLVLILLFPVIASMIAASRHIIGLQGFGVYIPAVLAVALLSTGIITGILLFVAILISASIGKNIFRKFHLQYLPRTALTLWLVSLAVFGLLLISPYLAEIDINLIAVTIFPILVLILLSENFIEAQLAGSQHRAIELTIETIFFQVENSNFEDSG